MNIKISYENTTLIKILFLKNNLNESDFKNLDFERFVKISSSQLMLPALFVNLKKKNFFYFKYFFKYFFYNFPRNIFYYLISLRFIFNIYLYVFKLIKKNKKYDFFFILKNLNPDLVLFPNRLAEVETYKLLNDLNFLKSIKSYFIVDKWDNLGSKTALLKKPNFIGIWGEQAFQLAKINHKFKNSQIFKIGSVRLSDKIVNYKNKKKSFCKKPIVIFG